MVIGDSLPPRASGGSTDGRRDPQGVDRTADARAGLPAAYGADGSADYRSTSPVIQTWRSARPPANYPPTSYTGATYPVAGQSAATRPRLDTALTDRPIPGHPSADPPYGATTVARDGMRPEARCQEPGVARLQGGIEKPTESNLYDQHRSSIY